VTLTTDPIRSRTALDPLPRDEPIAEDDAIAVTCGACGTRQRASGRAGGYTCDQCGSVWRVLRCRECRQASVILDGVTSCPRCGHDHRPATPPAGALPAWLSEPAPLSVWIGGVKYLGGYAGHDESVPAIGLLLDRRGIHARAFAEVFIIPWTSVHAMEIEGTVDISERLSMSRLVALGASTWVTSIAYLTVRSDLGDAIFEVDGLGPPELRARLSRVLQGLEPADLPAQPIALERVERAEPAELDVDPTVATDVPLEVLLVDALWKLAKLRDGGLLGPAEVSVLRARLLARLEEAGPGTGEDGGPLLRV
jgi:predicted RNA-binding Zn-ribbon protein involved in translation (DUF1610 family)